MQTRRRGLLHIEKPHFAPGLQLSLESTLGTYGKSLNNILNADAVQVAIRKFYSVKMPGYIAPEAQIAPSPLLLLMQTHLQ